MYQQLDVARIIETAEVLENRINERFPGSSLGRVAQELVTVARSAEVLARWLGAPLWWMRVGIGFILFALAFLLFGALSLAVVSTPAKMGFWESVQGVEAAVNDLIFIGVAVYFLVGIERRFKRKRAQKALHVLRSLSHVVDMHQLTKDPERITGGGPRTASSPERNMSPFELARYLDYCSEILALASKIAAFWIQDFDDAEARQTASDVEDLTIGLSRNIWQKILVLERIAPTTSTGA